MSSIFKLGRDKGKKNACWYFEYLDQDGRNKMKEGFTDKSLTQQLASKCESESRQRRLGLVDAVQEKQAATLRSPLQSHLDEFGDSLAAKKNTKKHRGLTISRITKIINGCEFKLLSDLNADDVEGYLSECMTDGKFGYRTYNHYLQAMESWCNWLVKRSRIARSPIVGLARLNAELDVRHRRRALSPEEFSLLLNAARSSEEAVQCYSGEVRARIYTISFMTGLRKGEIASLTPRSFQLEAAQPTVTIEAKSSKHRKTDVLPLHPDLVPYLRKWTQGLRATEPLFPKLASRKTWLMVRKDLERAGIDYRTDDGIADFHAAGRHSHITELLRSGATVAQAMELARHSDVRMTMRYTHVSLAEQARALSTMSLPCQDCQDIVRKSAFTASHRSSSLDTDGQTEEAGDKEKSPGKTRAFVSFSQSASADAGEDQKWRRRESNPRPAIFP